MSGINRIVVDYGDYEGLVLLTSYDYMGNELPYNELLELDGFDIVKKYDGIKNFDDLRTMEEKNREGFVVRFNSGFRVKLKFSEYVRLHRLLTNFSNVDIWECLRNKTNFNDFLDRVPDEFDSWVRGVKNGLVNEYHRIEENIQLLFEEFKYKRLGFSFDSVGKKEFAMWVKEQPRQYQPILFSLYDEKDYSDTIWRMIRPTYQKPFWNKEVE
jgi:RNA ligase